MSTIAKLLYFLSSCVITFCYLTSLPNIQYDLLESKVWACSKKFEKKFKKLEHSLQVHILYQNKTTLVIVASEADLFINDDHQQQIIERCHLIGPAINTSKYSEIIQQRSTADRFNKRSADPSLEWFESYHNYSAIYEWFQQLNQNHPDTVEFITIGQTINKREIFAIKITNKDENVVKDKPKVYIQCLLHAREWITGPMCMYIAFKFVNNDLFDGDGDITMNSQITGILSNVEIIIVPVANPDGYELTWIEYPKYRLWRKNLMSFPDKECVGVDLNRNFNVKWGVYGSSTDVCSETYQGISPTSEEETKAITKFLLRQKTVVGTLDFHSYSQVILYPAGWTNSLVDNSDQFRNIAQKMAEVASQADIHTKYTSQQMGSIYLASGTFGDWVNSDEFIEYKNADRDEYHQPISLTVELSPRDEPNLIGFMVTPDKILPTCRGMFKAVLKYISLVLPE